MKKNLFIAIIVIAIIGGGLVSCDVVAPECVELRALTAELKKVNSQGGAAVNAWFRDSQNANRMTIEVYKCTGDATDIKDPRMSVVFAANEVLTEALQIQRDYALDAIDY